MVTFVEKPSETQTTTKEVDHEALRKEAEEFSKKSFLREIKLEPQEHLHIRDRMWLWFPLVVESGMASKPRDPNFHTVYPKIIQWKDGRYYTYRGTHTADPKYNIKGDNTVHYAEILTEEGERIEYSTINIG